jgi:hypothetical protein
VALENADRRRLGRIAAWERVVRERSSAATVANWEQMLHARSEMDVRTPALECVAGHLPIRKETRELLLRPPEVDFQVGREAGREDRQGHAPAPSPALTDGCR